MRATRIALAGIAVSMVSAVPALAQEADRPAAATSVAPPDSELGGDSITLGVAAAYLNDYEGSDDYRFAPGPAVLGSVRGHNFSVIGNRASIDLIPNAPGPGWDIQLGPVGVVNFNRQNRNAIEDRRVRALPERKIALELGGYVGIGKVGVITSPYDRLSVTVSYRHDVTGIHRSGIWTPSINYLTPLSRKAAVGLFGSAERVESRYLRTYFNVNAAESLASGLPVYSGRRGWKNWTVGGFATYSISGDLLHGWKLVGGGTYKRMLNDAADSPLVSIAGSRSQWVGALGVAYTF